MIESESGVPGEHDALMDVVSREMLPFMWQGRRHMTRAFEPLGLTPIYIALLKLIEMGEDQPTKLAEQLGIVKQALSTLLRDLEEDGLVERSNSLADKRRVQVELTAQGRALCHEAAISWREATKALLVKMDVGELNTLLALCRKARSDP